MIYTVTLNPSLDYYMELDELQAGIINRSKSERLEVGGKGINVSKVLKELGIESTICGFYAGLIGETIVSETKKLGIDTRWVEVKGNSRINVKLLCEPETAINGSGCQANIEDLDKLCEAINSDDDSIIVFSGSICKGLGNHAYAYMMSKLHGKIVVDAEEELLTNTLRYKPFLIKPNNIELGKIFNADIKTFQQAIIFGRRLCEAGAQNCVVSMGKMGSVFVNNTEAHIVNGKQVEAKTTVGAGDTILAGMLYGLAKRMRQEEALLYATRLTEDRMQGR